MDHKERESYASKNLATLDVLPDNFTTLDEFWGFWDTHSSADYEDAMEVVEIELDPWSSTVYVPVAKDLVSKVRAQARRQVYHRKHWSTLGDLGVCSGLEAAGALHVEAIAQAAHGLGGEAQHV